MSLIFVLHSVREDQVAVLENLRKSYGARAIYDGF